MTTYITCPEWAAIYLVTGNEENLTPEGKALIDDYLWAAMRNLETGETISFDFDDDEEGEYPYFSNYPDFGPPAMCYCIKATIKGDE